MTAVDGGNLPCYWVDIHKVRASDLMVAGMLNGGRQERRLVVGVNRRDEEFGEPRPGVEGGGGNSGE